MKNNNDITNGNCWIAYFDVLGFSRMIKEDSGNLVGFVEVDYKEIIRALITTGKYDPDFVNILWFSDTFLLFTNDGSKGSLSKIDIAARHFFVNVIKKRIPLRGALSFGEFYADKQNNIFVGEGLIDAYKYAEYQNWLGFIMTPSAILEASKLGLCPPDRSKYIEYDVPCKCQKSTEKLYVFKPPEYPNLRESVEQLYKESQNTCANDDNVMLKYKNTLEFL
ncbi:MAG TPA: hypothetical protein DDW84_03340 [Phycisphaerales bacterium]|nr:MAG: hypothetical protein A2Y13_06915 [Planctomycetes bacterium GWC2_45_44]HBG77873.1 hypothetical protein [Phycisphaerales bacterium]HBR18650.1 hypothetical protein [Phycisphaerales bacterium]